MVGILGNSRQMLLVAGVLALVAVASLLVRRRFGGHLSKDVDSLTAMSAAILSVYGILLGLTLAASWERYQRAEDALVSEANGLYAVSRLAASFPGPGGDGLRQAVLDYGRTVIDNELTGAPEDLVDTSPGAAAMTGIYRAMTAVGAGPDAGLPSAQPTWDAVVALDNARGERLMLSHTALPVQFWVVLIFGATVTILSLIAVLPQSGRIHVAISVGVSLMLLLMLLLLSDLNHPFEGPDTVDFSNYRSAVGNLEEESGASAAQARIPAVPEHAP